MNGYVRILLLIIIDLLSFKLGGFWFGIAATGIVVFRILSIIGFTRSPVIYRGFFKDGICFTKDHLGSYSNLHEAFKEALKLIEQFKLKDYVVIGIYYDQPGEVEESKLRSSVGIYKKNMTKIAEKIPEDFEKYCESKGYIKNELPMADSLYSNWDYINVFSMMLGIYKFYNLLKQNLKDNFFKKQFRVDEKKIKVSIETYEANNIINFYVPFINGEKFMIFKKDK